MKPAERLYLTGDSSHAGERLGDSRVAVPRRCARIKQIEAAKLIANQSQVDLIDVVSGGKGTKEKLWRDNLEIARCRDERARGKRSLSYVTCNVAPRAGSIRIAHKKMKGTLRNPMETKIFGKPTRGRDAAVVELRGSAHVQQVWSQRAA
ncbi:hypothetical protein [Olsenella uli]|uniref:hypothetical protein n=1 Tax=Olsenella uli TaxID=133926 RepID=UPI0012AB5238|nr:hypothetical protein [Olsenella uli]